MRNKHEVIQYEPKPNPSTSLDEPSFGAEVIGSEEAINGEMKLQIAVRKGIKLCTQCPIARHVSYYKLCKNYKFFLSLLSSCVISRRVEKSKQSVIRKKAI